MRTTSLVMTGIIHDASLNSNGLVSVGTGTSPPARTAMIRSRTSKPTIMSRMFGIRTPRSLRPTKAKLPNASKAMVRASKSYCSTSRIVPCVIRAAMWTKTNPAIATAIGISTPNTSISRSLSESARIRAKLMNRKDMPPISNNAIRPEPLK